MDLEPTLSPRFMIYIRDYLSEYSIDPEPILSGCNISIDADEEFDPPLSISKVAHLFTVAAAAANDDYLGLSLAQRYHYESASLLLVLVLAAPSVQEGIKTLCRYDRYMDTAIETDFGVSEDMSTFTVKVIDYKNSALEQITEFLIFVLISLLNKGTRKVVPVKEVHFIHDSNKRLLKPMEDFISAPVKFNQDTNSIIFESAYLHEPFCSSNSMLYDILTDAFKTYFISGKQENQFTSAVCREVAKLSSAANVKLADVASALMMTERTLKRRLSDEGLSFQEVKNITRTDRAKYYLNNTNMPLSEIAYKLGYSELSAFSRAFRAWTGDNPQYYRETVRKFIGR